MSGLIEARAITRIGASKCESHVTNALDEAVGRAGENLPTDQLVDDRLDDLVGELEPAPRSARR